MNCPVCGEPHATCGGPAALLYDPTDLNMAPINPQASSKQMWRNDTGERIYLDKDDKVVTDPEKQDPVKFLVGPNLEIPLADAVRYGLAKPDGEKAESAPKDDGDEFSIDGIPHQAVEALKKEGIYSKDGLSGKTDEELTALPGVGEATVKKIREALK